jgi:hypothetical protein
MPRFQALSFTEKRRRTLAMLKGQRLHQYESRSTVTPIGAAALSFGVLPIMGQVDTTHATGEG